MRIEDMLRKAGRGVHQMVSSMGMEGVVLGEGTSLHTSASLLGGAVTSVINDGKVDSSKIGDGVSRLKNDVVWKSLRVGGGGVKLGGGGGPMTNGSPSLSCSKNTGGVGGAAVVSKTGTGGRGPMMRGSGRIGKDASSSREC